MKVDILTFCESANLRNNRLDIVGASERFKAPTFPARFNNIFLVYRLRFEIDDFNSPPIKLLLTNEDGKTIFEASKDRINKVQNESGGFCANVAVIPFSSVVIPEPGEYSLSLIGGSVVLASIPLYCNIG